MVGGLIFIIAIAFDCSPFSEDVAEKIPVRDSSNPLRAFSPVLVFGPLSRHRDYHFFCWVCFCFPFVYGPPVVHDAIAGCFSRLGLRTLLRPGTGVFAYVQTDAASDLAKLSLSDPKRKGKSKKEDEEDEEEEEEDAKPADKNKGCGTRQKVAPPSKAGKGKGMREEEDDEKGTALFSSPPSPSPPPHAAGKNPPTHPRPRFSSPLPLSLSLLSPLSICLLLYVFNHRSFALTFLGSVFFCRGEGWCRVQGG